MSPEEYDRKVDKLIVWAQAYYDRDNPIATDEEYDRLYSEVKEVEHTYKYHREDSPTQYVGGSGKSSLPSVPHTPRMWSLDNVFNQVAMEAWCANQGSDLELTLEPKFDGMSLRLHYLDGKLDKAVTRGTGIEGEDVTSNAKELISIPKVIKNSEGLMQISGEVCMTYKSFDKVNKLRAKQGKELFANPRNAAAGSMRLLDSSLVKERELVFVPWAIEDALDHGFKTGMEVIKYFKSNKFKMGTDRIVTNDLKVVETMYHRYIKERPMTAIPLDGMVVKNNNLAKRTKLGYTKKFPRWAIAYKFPAVEKATKLIGVEWDIGRTGVLTPVGILEPILLDGSTVARVTLNNSDYIKEKDVKIGDEVVIIKSGDIIPKLIKVFHDRRDKVSDIVIPEECPYCKTLTSKEDAYVKCNNDKCSEKIIKQITYFGSRGCMDIDGLGEATVKALLDSNCISTLNSVYLFPKNTPAVIAAKELLGDKTIDNLISGIENSKGKYLDTLLASIGIPGAGEHKLRLITNKYGLDFMELSVEEMIAIKGIGETLAKNVSEYLSVHEASIQELIDLTLPKVREPEVEGITICITGTFKNKDKVITRDAAKELLKEDTLSVNKGMTKIVDVLLVGDKAGKSKMNYATKHDIPMLMISNDFKPEEIIKEIRELSK